MDTKTKSKIESIDLIHTDGELELIKTLIQILLYILSLIIDMDETHDFFEEVEAELLKKLENLLQDKLSGKSNIYKILNEKKYNLNYSNTNTKLNNEPNTQINVRNRNHNYEPSL